MYLITGSSYLLIVYIYIVISCNSIYYQAVVYIFFNNRNKKNIGEIIFVGSLIAIQYFVLDCTNVFAMGNKDGDNTSGTIAPHLVVEEADTFFVIEEPQEAPSNIGCCGVFETCLENVMSLGKHYVDCVDYVGDSVISICTTFFGHNEQESRNDQSEYYDPKACVYSLTPLRQREQSSENIEASSDSQEKDMGQSSHAGQHIVTALVHQPPPSSSQHSLDARSSISSESSSFIQQYFIKTQHVSLQQVQCVLLDTSQHIANVLKTLTFTMYTSTCQPGIVGVASKKNYTHSIAPKNFGSFTPRSNNELFSSERTQYSPIRYRFFSFIDNKVSKVGSSHNFGQAGVIIDFLPTVRFGVACNRNTRESQKDHTFQKIVNHSLKAKTDMNGFSASFLWNPETLGIRAQVSNYYGFGKVKTCRSVSNGRGHSNAKGSSKSIFYGMLAQLGYAFPCSSSTTIMPYIECLTSRVQWNPYQEITGFLPCYISKNQEKVFEKTFGLQMNFKMTDTSQMQAWLARNTGYRKTDGLILKPVAMSIQHLRAAVVSCNKRYSQYEVGILYDVVPTEVFHLGLAMRSYVSKRIPIVRSQYLGIQMRYCY